MNNRVLNIAFLITTVVIYGCRKNDNNEHPNANIIEEQVVKHINKECFKTIFDILIDSNENIYIHDNDNIFKIDKSLSRIKCIVGSGQGPNELSDLSRIGSVVMGIGEDGIISLYSSLQRKMLLYNGESDRIDKSFKINGSAEDIYRINENEYLVVDQEEMGYVPDLPVGVFSRKIYLLLANTPDGINKRKIAVLNSTYNNQSPFIVPITPFYVVVNDRYDSVYVVDSSEYCINKISIWNDKITIIKREYARVYNDDKNPLLEELVSKYQYPKIKYKFDISGLYCADGYLLVPTSTAGERGTLIDMYSDNGRYIKSMYFKIDGKIMGIKKNHIYTRCEDSDGNPYLKIYRYTNE